MNGLLAILAQQQPAQQQGGFLGMFAPLLIIFAIFYFLIIRPQQKQQKKLKTMIENMRNGDAVITRGGIHGKLISIEENTAMIEIADRVQIKVTRDAIIHVNPSNR